MWGGARGRGRGGSESKMVRCTRGWQIGPYLVVSQCDTMNLLQKKKQENMGKKQVFFVSSKILS